MQAQSTFYHSKTMTKSVTFALNDLDKCNDKYYCCRCQAYLQADKFYPCSIRTLRPLCKACTLVKRAKQYKNRTVLERLRNNVRTRFVSAGLKECIKEFSTDDVHDILDAHGIKVRRKTLASEWEYKHVQLFPPHSKTDLKEPSKWIVVMLDEYYPDKKRTKPRTMRKKHTLDEVKSWGRID